MKIKGVDVSKFQKGQKIADYKAAGQEFVIIRAGYTGWTGKGVTKVVDSEFENFYKQAKACGMPVGAYWYSTANNATKGRDEAIYMYEHCLKGKQFEMPIFIDCEDNHWQSKTWAGTTDAIVAFCETLEQLGYFVGVYASKYWFSKLGKDKLKPYLHWLAWWTSTEPTEKTAGVNFGIWQFGSVKVKGKNIDGNIAYKDYAKIIKEGGFNGFNTKPQPEPQPEPKPEPVEPQFKKGDKVQIIANGNARKDGKGKTSKGIGYKRYILDYYAGEPFPYRVGNLLRITTGYYAASALKKL